MALGAFVSGWVVDHFGAQNGFWVSVAAAAAAFITVSLGQRTLAGAGKAAPAARPLPMMAE
jgi:predicted MFS family arabinose efflux permease